MTDIKENTSWQGESREIKFRVFLPLHHHSDTIKMREQMYYCDSFIMVHNATHTNWYESSEIKRPFIIMQYTWLKDKNWVEIYEWDIVKYDWNSLYWEIKMIDGCWCFGRYSSSFLLYWYSMWYYVVWNIYQNPELLSEK